MLSTLIPYTRRVGIAWQDCLQRHEYIGATIIFLGALTFAVHAKGETEPNTSTTVVNQPRESLGELPAVAQSQTFSSNVTLAELEQLALQNNPTIAGARAQVLAAQGRQVQAGLYPNPTVGYLGDQMGDEGTAGMQGGFVSQEFVTAGKLRLDQAVAGHEIQASQQMWRAQELRVLSDVRMRFYAALVAQKRVALTGDLITIGEQSSQLTDQLLRVQQVSQSDLLQAQIETEEARNSAIDAKNQSAEAWRRLAVVVGVPTLDERNLAGQLEASTPEYQWEETLDRILGANPEVAAAQARIQRARVVIERQRREVIPNVELMTEVYRMNQSDSDAATVRVGVPLPVFNRNQGNRLQADAELIAAQNEAGRIELDLRDRLAMAFRRYATARQQVERYRKEILPRAQQSIDVVRRGYEAGQINFLSLLTSQRTYIRANLMYVDTLNDMWQAATLIEGQLLSDSLQGESAGREPLK